jgi:hypothetical protein
MFKKILLSLLLISATLSHAQEEPRAFYELLYGSSTETDDNSSSIGLGLRFTYPASDNFYLGYKGEVGFTSDSTGYFGRLALSTDIRLQGDLFLTADFGYAWGYDNVVDSNGTSIGYSETPQSAGTYYTAGARYQFSDFVEVAVMYRNTLMVPFDLYSSTRTEEMLFSLNFAITEESLQVFSIFFEE